MPAHLWHEIELFTVHQLEGGGQMVVFHGASIIVQHSQLIAHTHKVVIVHALVLIVVDDLWRVAKME